MSIKFLRMPLSAKGAMAVPYTVNLVQVPGFVEGSMLIRIAHDLQ